MLRRARFLPYTVTDPMTRCMLAVLLLASGLATAQPSASTTQEITQLFAALETSGCRFQRNGNWHEAPEAKAHLQRKYDYLLEKRRHDHRILHRPRRLAQQRVRPRLPCAVRAVRARGQRDVVLRTTSGNRDLTVPDPRPFALRTSAA